MSLRSLLQVVRELRRSEPPLLTLDFTVVGRPADFPAKGLKVSLGELPPLLLNRVTELALGEFGPKPLNSGEVGRRDTLDFSKVHKVPAGILGSG